MLQIGKLLVLLVLCLGLAGCSSVPPAPSRVTSIPGEPAEPPPPSALAPVPAEPVAAPGASIPLPVTPKPIVAPPVAVPPVATNAVRVPTPLVTDAPPAPASNRWVLVQEWCLTNGLAKPVKRLDGDNTVFTLQTTNGPVVLRPGNQVATWNNLNWWLGFAPRVSKGEIYLHPLDLQKNIIPVALNPTRLSPVSRTIVIDAGHGGDNHGTRSVLDRRQLEKEYTLDWAKRLKPLLEQRGWRVHMTRVADINLSTTNRVELADAVRADLFVSLHFNSSPTSPEQSGLETYCLTPVGLPSSVTRDYADNASHPYSNNAWDLQNFIYATQIHRSLVETTRAADRGVRRARFMDVLRNQRRPAILVEGGYLSNPREAKLIARSDYRQKLAEAVARGLE